MTIDNLQKCLLKAMNFLFTGKKFFTSNKFFFYEKENVHITVIYQRNFYSI